MDTTSPRFKKLLIGGAAVLALGIGLPAQASSEDPGRPDPGSVGKAQDHAFPRGQDREGSKDRGFTCDDNKGVGSGYNPALAPDCDPATDTGSSDGPDSGSGGGTPATGDGATNTGGGSTITPWVPPTT